MDIHVIGQWFIAEYEWLINDWPYVYMNVGIDDEQWFAGARVMLTEAQAQGAACQLMVTAAITHCLRTITVWWEVLGVCVAVLQRILPHMVPSIAKEPST